MAEHEGDDQAVAQAVTAALGSVDERIDFPLEEEIALALVGVDGGADRALGHVFRHSGQNTGWHRLGRGSVFEGGVVLGCAHSGHFTHLG